MVYICYNLWKEKRERIHLHVDTWNHWKDKEQEDSSEDKVTLHTFLYWLNFFSKILLLQQRKLKSGTEKQEWYILAANLWVKIRIQLS